MMPKMDGYHVCRILKFDERYRKIPIIMLTARGQEQDKVTGSEVRADLYITKPFEAAYLMEMVKNLLHEGSGGQTKKN